MVQLSDICSVITDGSHFSPEDEGIGYPMLSVKDMRDTDFDFSECKHVGSEAFQKLVSTGCRPFVGDVVVAKDGSYLKSAFPITQDRDIALLSSIAILRPDTTLVLPAYLSYYLKSPSVFRTVSLNYITGTALKRIILTGIRKLPIELPSLAEQQRRASLLDAIYRIIKARQCQLRTLDTLIKARFVEMFGDESQFVSAPLDNSVEEMFIGPFGSSLKNECFVPAEDGFCMVYEQKHAIRKTMDVDTRYVDEKKYHELQRFTVLGGDIIVSCRGTIGETFIVPDDAPIGIMHPSIMKIRLKSTTYNRVFFNHLLQTVLKRHEDEANGSGVKMAITATALGQESFIIPSMTLQNQFAAFVYQVDKSKVAIQAALEKAQLLFDSLMQQYFN